MENNALIYIAGHTGLVGSAIVRLLREQGYDNLLVRTHSELDLTDQQKTLEFFLTHKPDYVFLDAAKVGGIIANSQNQADFIFQNLAISTNVIHAAHASGVKKLLNLGSACIYPKDTVQLITETQLLTGALEPTNEGYAIAKIAAVKMCRYFNEQYGTNFMSIMPANLYGIHDNFDLNSSHVLPALIHKFHLAKKAGHSQVVLFGTGQPRREFLYVDDCAHACIKLMEKRQASDVGEIANIGYGSDVEIKELADMIAEVVGFTGDIVWDTAKPDGVSKRLLDSRKIQSLIDWKPKVSLSDGIRMTYHWYCRQNQRDSDTAEQWDERNAAPTESRNDPLQNGTVCTSVQNRIDMPRDSIWNWYAHRSKKKVLPMKVVDYWRGWEHDITIMSLLSQEYDLRYVDNPNVIFCHQSGSEHREYTCPKIFCAGEPDAFNQEDYDLTFTFDYTECSESAIRFPLYGYYFPNTTLCKQNVRRVKRPKFCAFVASRDIFPERVDFVKRLSKYKQVACCGSVLNNTGFKVGGTHSSAELVSFYSDYKFVMAFENTVKEGYTTEKIATVMAAQSIPIYYGNPKVHRDFNPKSFVNVHEYGSFDEAIDRIIALDQDDDLYFQTLQEPWFYANVPTPFVDTHLLVSRLVKWIEERKLSIAPEE